ncbi:MAG: toll/interleukin-1 receptor domain-containing protein [Phycisphaeraceae bacterium]
MKVFLSHSDKDGPVAEKLAASLTQAGLEVWRTALLLPGDNWASKLAEALETSDAMVVLISPDAMASTHVRREIDFALGSTNYKDRLVPVQIRATKNIPWILNRLHVVRADPRRIALAAPKILAHLKQTA